MSAVVFMFEHQPLNTSAGAAQLFDRAVELHQAGKLQDAQALYRQTLALAPDHADSLHLLGLIARESGDSAAAHDLVARAVAVDEGNATFHNTLGVVFQELGKLDLAVASLRRAIALEHDYAEAHNNLGNALREQGRLGEAEDAFRQALTFRPKNAKAHNNLGIVLKDQGRLDEAADSYRRAVALKPDYAEAFNNLGAALTAAEDIEPAIVAFQNALALRPGYAEAHNNLGVALKEQGRISEAEASYRKAAQLRPALIDAQVNLGHVLFDQGKRDEAAAAAAAARALNPGPGPVQFPLGDLLLKLGDTAAAELHLRSYLAFEPEDRMGARLLLASFGAEALPAQASEAFVRDLYAKRARFWDRTATREHPYRGARLVSAAALRQIGKTKDIAILDAGCGTGLVGAVMRPHARRLDGVDLSPAMIEAARAKDVYDDLVEGDLVALMQSRPATYDIVLSAATLIHFGDLAPVFAAAAQALRAQGLFIFTVFPFEAETPASGFGVAQISGLAYGGCYAHGPKYLQTTAQAVGFTIAGMDREVHEHHNAAPVTGLVVTLRKN